MRTAARPGRPYLGVEHLVLHYVEVHGEEPGLQRGAERVPLHQPDLGVGGLVAQQVLLRGDHVLDSLTSLHILIREKWWVSIEGGRRLAV